MQVLSSLLCLLLAFQAPMKATLPGWVFNAHAVELRFLDLFDKENQGSLLKQTVLLQERLEFLKEDLKHLFDDQGVDQSQYDDRVNFMDPITKYNSVKGSALLSITLYVKSSAVSAKSERTRGYVCIVLHWYGAGYMFNIGMLKTIFSPTFQMHDIRQTGEYEITTRWTMMMRPTLNRISPFRRWWDPTLVFTGVSIMGINPENGIPLVLTSTD